MDWTYRLLCQDLHEHAPPVAAGIRRRWSGSRQFFDGCGLGGFGHLRTLSRVLSVWLGDRRMSDTLIARGFSRRS